MNERLWYGLIREGRLNTIHLVLIWQCLEFVHVEHNATGDLAVMHVIVNLREVAGRQGLVETLHFASGSKRRSLRCILPIADVRSNDLLLEDHGEEYIDLDVATGWQSNSNARAVRSDIFNGLLVC